MHHKNPNDGIFEFKLFSFDSHRIAVDQCNIAARGLLSFASEHRICNTFALKRFVYLRNLVSIPHESSAITGDVYNSIEGWLNLTCFKLSQRLAGKSRE